MARARAHLGGYTTPGWDLEAASFPTSHLTGHTQPYPLLGYTALPPFPG